MGWRRNLSCVLVKSAGIAVDVTSDSNELVSRHLHPVPHPKRAILFFSPYGGVSYKIAQTSE
jgi:hypothetical protein